jgi:hypothetical protein
MATIWENINRGLNVFMLACRNLDTLPLRPPDMMETIDFSLNFFADYVLLCSDGS